MQSVEAVTAQVGEADFEHEYRTVYRSAFLLARQLGCSTAEAEDAVQEAALRAWRYRAARHGPFPPWFLKIVFRAATKPRRHLAWLPWTPSAADSAASVPDLASAWDQDVIAALSRLPARQRAALWLRYCEDLSTASVASVMGTTEAAIKQLLLRARAALRKEMERDGS